jgi:hypothetical protein
MCGGQRSKSRRSVDAAKARLRRHGHGMQNTMRTTTKLCGSTATRTGKPCENLTADGRGCHLHRDGASARPGDEQAIGLPSVSAAQDDPSSAEVSAPVESDRVVAAGNPNALEDVLMTLMRDKDWRARWAAATHPNASESVLMAALRDEYWDVRCLAAGNPNASEDVLRIAMRDEIDYVREAAAENPNTPGDALMALVNDEHWRVRLAAARNPNASEDALRVAMLDVFCDVRRTALENPNAPESLRLQWAAMQNGV